MDRNPLRWIGGVEFFCCKCDMDMFTLPPYIWIQKKCEIQVPFTEKPKGITDEESSKAWVETSFCSKIPSQDLISSMGHSAKTWMLGNLHLFVASDISNRALHGCRTGHSLFTRPKQNLISNCIHLRIQSTEYSFLFFFFQIRTYFFLIILHHGFNKTLRVRDALKITYLELKYFNNVT